MPLESVLELPCMRVPEFDGGIGGARRYPAAIGGEFDGGDTALVPA